MAARPKPPIQPHAVDDEIAAEAIALHIAATGLKSGDGGGNSGGMEARVAKLEAHMEHVLQDVALMKADVGTLKTDTATIKVKIDNLPSKDFVVKVVVGSAALLGALQVFGPFLAKLLGLK